MSEMTDLGHKMDMGTEATPMSEKDMKEHICYPSLCLDTTELPELKGISVGEEVELHFIAKVTGMNISDHGSGKRAHYDFELHQGSVDTGAEEMDDADEMMQTKPKKMPMDEE